MKILLNAEAFGFGPSASISAIFDIIKDSFPHYELDYIGQGHTLDLQSHLSYSQIFQYESEAQFKSIVKNYDFFITALDFEKAKFAKEMNVKTIVYDTLLWYWKDKNIVSHADYYITQDFYGVQDIVTDMKLTNSFVIPPLIQKKDINKKCEDFLLINFGGLENPYWSIEVTANYIKKMLLILLPIVSSQFKKIKIVCSKSHIPYLQKLPVETASYQEMQNLLQKASYIIATSGLGNIYELANYQVPCLFLPPVNDSQGQQIEILKKEGLVDNQLDWKDFEQPIDYFNSQKKVLDDIEYCIQKFSNSSHLKNKEYTFSQQIEDKLKFQGNLSLNELFESFGFNGKNELKNILKTIL